MFERQKANAKIGKIYAGPRCTKVPLAISHQMEVDGARGDGLKPYYVAKIEELQLVVAEKSQDLRRLQAQRNELNAKGMSQSRGVVSVLWCVGAFTLPLSLDKSMSTTGPDLENLKNSCCNVRIVLSLVW